MPPSIHKKLYPKKGNHRLILAGILLFLVISIIIFISPASVWVEIILVSAVVGFFYFLTSGFFGKNKWSLIIPVGVLGLLIMGRWGILDFLLFGLWVAVLILISLFN